MTQYCYLITAEKPGERRVSRRVFTTKERAHIFTAAYLADGWTVTVQPIELEP